MFRDGGTADYEGGFTSGVAYQEDGVTGRHIEGPAGTALRILWPSPASAELNTLNPYSYEKRLNIHAAQSSSSPYF
jgi:hypothetical protein